MVKLTIGIINRNTAELLYGLLSQIYQANLLIPFEVIVVDNGSNDGSYEMVKDKFPGAKVIRNQENKGFTIPCNQIIKEMKGEYLFLLNTDIILYPDTFEKILSFLDSNPKIGVCGPKLYNRDMTIQLSAQKYHTLSSIFWEIIGLAKLLPKSAIFGYAPYFKNEISQPIEVDYISGAFMAINKKTIDTVGMFDERFFIYTQEVDFCLRCKKQGWKIYYYPGAHAIHLQGETSKKLSIQADYWLWQDRLVYFQKHYGKTYAALCCFIIRTIMFLKLLIINSLTFNRNRAFYRKQKSYRLLFKNLKSNDINLR